MDVLGHSRDCQALSGPASPGRDFVRRDEIKKKNPERHARLAGKGPPVPIGALTIDSRTSRAGSLLALLRRERGCEASFYAVLLVLLAGRAPRCCGRLGRGGNT